MNQQKVGQFLKTLRSQKSITQAGLAEVLGVSNRKTESIQNAVGKNIAELEVSVGHGGHYNSSLIMLL